MSDTGEIVREANFESRAIVMLMCQSGQRTAACVPAPSFPTRSWWTTTPSSRARCFAPSSRACARASSSARPITRTPGQRQGRVASGACQQRHGHPSQRHAARLRQRPQGGLGQSSLATAWRLSSSTAEHTGPPSPTLASSPVAPSDHDLTAGESPANYAQRMRAMEATVRELLAAAQADRKAKLDAGRVDTVFQVGDRVLLRTKELLDAADIGKLRPRWDGPFTVLACPSPNAYTLALPRRMRCSPTVNVDRLKPFFERFGAPPAPGPVSDRDRRASRRWSCCSTAAECAESSATWCAGGATRPLTMSRRPPSTAVVVRVAGTRTHRRCRPPSRRRRRRRHLLPRRRRWSLGMGQRFQNLSSWQCVSKHTAMRRAWPSL